MVSNPLQSLMDFSSRATLVLLLIATLLSTALAAASTGSSTTNTASSFIQASCTLPEPGLPFCSFEGQSDFYGLGVRMGIYFTWLTSWIANNFLPDEISGSLDTNAVFLLAISVTVIYNSIHHQLRIIDALVLLQLCYGFLFGVMSLWGYRTMYYHRMGAAGRSRFGGFGTHMRLLLMTAISAYAVWFWFEGMKDGLIECNMREACGGLETFFFTRVKLFGWIRTFYKISAVGCVAYYGVMTAVAIVWLAVRCLKFLKHGRKGWKQGYNNDEPVDAGLTQRELSYAYIAIAGFNFFWMLFSALTVEFTLNYNHMTNVLGEHGLSGPGQQLPLLIGLFSFLRICWVFVKDRYLHDSDSEATGETQTRRAGLGIGISRAATDPSTGSTPISPAATRFPQQHAHLNSIPLLAAHADRPWVQRVLVAYLPWMADFKFFRSPRNEPQGFEAVRREGPALEMQRTAYQGKGRVAVDVESLGGKDLKR